MAIIKLKITRKDANGMPLFSNQFRNSKPFIGDKFSLSCFFLHIVKSQYLIKSKGLYHFKNFDRQQRFEVNIWHFICHIKNRNQTSTPKKEI
ncbi:MAG: hypothetical protein B1H11_02085 [Desulfobacteraceae bacterium 4484_190.1]|nr:MAG: hypothetical protein B1H11_02085 [Desulfobacteraceae bacterium 4484_190.1]